MSKPRISRRESTAVPVALVTGAARGIGAATVARLARDGWRVLALDLCGDDPAVPYALATRTDLECAIQTASRVAAPGCEPRAIVADVRDEQALRSAAEAASMPWGGLDAVIACAGVIGGGLPAWEMDEPLAHAIIDTNLWGVISLARACIPLLLQRPIPRRGRFIAVSSAASIRGMKLLSIYGASKAAVEGFVRGLGAELAGSGITANCVSPGSTQTLMLKESARLYGYSDARQFADQTTINRLIDPEEVADAICWLARPASSAVTGSVIRIDGGLSL